MFGCLLWLDTFSVSNESEAEMLLIFVIMFFMLLNNLFNISIIAANMFYELNSLHLAKRVLLLIELEGLSLLLLLISAAFSKQEPMQ